MVTANAAAGEVVCLGDVPNSRPSRCRNLINAFIPTARWAKNTNSRFDVMDVFGRRWYFKCTGRFHAYWDMDDEKRAKTKPRQCGLVASEEWREKRNTCYMVLACTKPFKKRIPNSKDRYVLNGRSNVFTIVDSEQDLLMLYERFPAADRFFSEVILPSMPHKCFMDIECDYFEDVTSVGVRKRIEYLKKGLWTLFIPRVCEFFTNVLGVHIRREDCYVMDASRDDSKFSVHLTVSTPNCHYFRTRSDSWIAMVLLAKHVKEYADSCPDFADWLYYENERGDTDMVWDFGIYGSGARNMRMLGACKANGVVVGTPWTQCRVFRPVAHQERADWRHFLASVNAIVCKTPIAITEGHMLAAATFADQIRTKMDSNRPAYYWFRNSRNLSSEVRRRGLEFASAPGQPRARSITSRRKAANGATPAPLAAFGAPDGMEVLADEVRRMHQSTSGASPVFSDIQDHRRNLQRRFLKEASELLTAVCTAVHPGNTVVVTEEVSGAALATCSMSCQIPGRVEPKRMCYFGCTQGHHYVRLAIMVDLSVEYFCHACSNRATILMSCLRRKVVPPRCPRRPCPDDFAPGFIDYEVVPPADDEKPNFMRRIRPLQDTGRCLPEPGHRRTIIARGAMGSGKTFMTADFLRRVREEEQHAPTVLALSFRKMLAKMYANTFGLEMYSESEEYSLFECGQLACQLESIERLMRADENDPRLKTARKTWDVVVMDEIESVLAHFDSETLRSSVHSTWLIMSAIVRFSRVLIVCDADIGPRTFEFLRMMRTDSQLGCIENLSFHYNRYTKIATRFFDYVGEYEWYKELLRHLLLGHRVFYFSNHKKHMKAIKSMVVRDLTEEKTRLLMAGEDVSRIETVLKGIKRIDADTTDAAKMNLVNCNKEWVKTHLVMISPTVGAGIDFTEKHFQVAFGYAGQDSLSPRGWNQMRGRVRNLEFGECHVYIKDSVDAEAEENLRAILNEETEAPGFQRVTHDPRRRPIADAGPDDNNESSTDRSDANVPVTLEGALDYMDRRTELYALDALDINESYGENMLCFRRVGLAESLRRILALNLVEKSRGKICFRNELIKVLQVSDPDVEYRFREKYDFQRNREHEVRVLHFKAEDEVKHACTTAEAVEADWDDTKKTRRLDMQGEPISSLPIDVYNDKDLAAAKEKNEIKHFYGLKSNIPVSLWTQIVRVAGAPRTREAVKNFAFILAAGFHDLDEHEIRMGPMREMEVRMNDTDDAHVHRVVCRAKGSEELWPSMKMKRYHLHICLWAAGFEVSNPFDSLSAENPMEIMPGVGCGGGHEALARERLQNPVLQVRLKTHHQAISKELCGQTIRAREVPSGDWDFKAVRMLTKRALGNTFNLDVLTVPRRPSKNKRKRDERDDASMTDSACSSVTTPSTRSSSNSVAERSRMADGILSECPVVTHDEYVHQTKCTDTSHREEGSKCGSLLHVVEDSLGLMLSLAWLYVHSDAMAEVREGELINAVRGEVDRMVTKWGRKPFLADYSVNGSKLFPPGMRPHAMETEEEEEMDGDNRQEATTNVDWDNHDQECLYGSGGYAEFMGDMSGYGDCEGDEQGGYGCGFDAIQPGMQLDGIREETQDEANGDDDDMNSIPDEAAAMHTLTEEEERAFLERPKKVARVTEKHETLEEQRLKRSLALATKPVTESEKALHVRAKQDIIRRYLGPDPYDKDAFSFVSMMLTPAYESRRQRLVAKLAIEAVATQEKNLERAGY